MFQQLKQGRPIEKMMTDLAALVVEHRYQAIEAADQLGIAVDIHFIPGKRRLLLQLEQGEPHRLAKMTVLPVIQDEVFAQTR